MKLQDYISYYIGCKCITPDGIGTITGLPWRILQRDMVTVHFGKQMIKTVNSVDGGYNKVRNHGDYLLFEKRYEPIGSEGITEDGFDMPGGVKPILRNLLDMTKEEEDELKAIKGTSIIYRSEPTIEITYDTPETFHWMLKKQFDLFELIENGLAIDSKTL